MQIFAVTGGPPHLPLPDKGQGIAICRYSTDAQYDTCMIVHMSRQLVNNPGVVHCRTACYDYSHFCCHAVAKHGIVKMIKCNYSAIETTLSNISVFHCCTK